MRRERLYLGDIVAAADAMAGFIDRQTSESFEANLMLRSAVVHLMTVIGEAVSRLSPELRDRYPKAPWTDIKGFRNIVVHNTSASIGLKYGVPQQGICQSYVTRSPESFKQNFPSGLNKCFKPQKNADNRSDPRSSAFICGCT